MDKRIAIVVLDSETETRGVNLQVAVDEESAEDRLGEEIENRVENGFGVGRDDIATFAETPGNGVENPKECSQTAAHEEDTADVTSVSVGVAAGFPD